ncbi:hypothetical protein LUZ60_000137 [Juncus effusus]|nr:hypothetical protein LUZ60_000137 [Juncus effusus]
MALQLRKLFPSSCVQRSLAISCKFPPTTIQYRAFGSFPLTNLPVSFSSSARYIRPLNAIINYNKLNRVNARLDYSGLNCKIPSQFKGCSFYSSKPSGKSIEGSKKRKSGFLSASSNGRANTAPASKAKKTATKSDKTVSKTETETSPSSKKPKTEKPKKAKKETEKVSASPAEKGASKGKKASTTASPSENETLIESSNPPNNTISLAKKVAVNNIPKKASPKSKKPKTTKSKTTDPSTKEVSSKPKKTPNESETLITETPKKPSSKPKKTTTKKKPAQTKTSPKKAPSSINTPTNPSSPPKTYKKTNPNLPLYPPPNPNSKSVVIVESVTKSKVIQNYLGKNYVVVPSYGHVRDLAGRSKSVRPDDDFSMVWEVPSSAWTHLKSIKNALNGAENLILASDPDREGEAIAWHITEMLLQQEALDENITVSRVVFHEITENAIKTALQSPRDIDMDLVNAYLARRALDYLIGFNISPLLWRKLPGCQSAGRVQSAALSLICERETQIEDFKPQEYWSVKSTFFKGEKGRTIESHLTHFEGKKLNQMSICTEIKAKEVEKRILEEKFEVLNVKNSKVSKNVPMPYITSTLQQDSANKLSFGASYTMKLAQKLYEGVKLSDGEATGLITYMRTDGLHISEEAGTDILDMIKQRYGDEYASKGIRKFNKKVKNAQEAHEAIRPTNIRRLPSSLREVLDDDSLKLYTLIWARTMACQMEPSRNNLIQVDIGTSKKDLIFRSSASSINFLGFRSVYEDKESAIIGKESDENEGQNEHYEILQALKVKDVVSIGEVNLDQHFTKPPPRYSEGGLVKKLEELGIGRPSTYASIMKVLQDRNYVTIKSRVLHPEFRGRMVSEFLWKHFAELSDLSFTADMENELDNVSAGSTQWKGLLSDYWSRFSKYCEITAKVNPREVEKLLESKLGHVLFAHLPENRVCPSCSAGTLRLKVSRFGAGYFIGCDQHPRCKYIAGTVFNEDSEMEESEKPEFSFQPKLLGTYPDSDQKVFLKNGPYGYYFQLGEDGKGFTPKRAPISKGVSFESVTIENAVEMLRYPVALGNHPDDGLPVVLTHSKYGFNVKHRSTIVQLPKGRDPKEITLDSALKLLLSKTAKHTGRPKNSIPARKRMAKALSEQF